MYIKAFIEKKRRSVSSQKRETRRPGSPVLTSKTGKIQSGSTFSGRGTCTVISNASFFSQRGVQRRFTDLPFGVLDGAIVIERGLSVPTSREANKYAQALSGLRKPDIFEVAFRPLAASCSLSREAN